MPQTRDTADRHIADRDTADRSRTLDLARHYPGRRVGHVAAHVRGAGLPDRSWRLGADGELRTASLLEGLTGRTRRDRLLGRPPRWRVLHSVPLDGGSADLDHVLIGPPGICVINSRHHRSRTVLLDGDRLTVSGMPTDAVPRARVEARRVRELLLPRLGADGAVAPVRPVIAVIGSPDDPGARMVLDRTPPLLGDGPGSVTVRFIVLVVGTGLRLVRAVLRPFRGLVLHVVVDLVDHAELLQQDGAHEAVEVAARHEPVLGGHVRPHLSEAAQPRRHLVGAGARSPVHPIG